MRFRNKCLPSKEKIAEWQRVRYWNNHETSPGLKVYQYDKETDGTPAHSRSMFWIMKKQKRRGFLTSFEMTDGKRICLFLSLRACIVYRYGSLSIFILTKSRMTTLFSVTLGLSLVCHPEHIRFAQCKLCEGSRPLNYLVVEIFPSWVKGIDKFNFLFSYPTFNFLFSWYSIIGIIKYFVIY